MTMQNHPSFGQSADDYSGKRLMTYDGEGRELGAYTPAQARAKWGKDHITIETNDEGTQTITVAPEGKE
jgi:hypothetical protein